MAETASAIPPRFCEVATSWCLSRLFTPSFAILDFFFTFTSPYMGFRVHHKKKGVPAVNNSILFGFYLLIVFYFFIFIFYYLVLSTPINLSALYAPSASLL
ncbi:hypothetical protein BGZ63DRAFT_12044 [Mariannaea sp. PMI_226]|nr:hypothetical protein BGZ63DRAFT_12044 [Mariannaea sp. PMI_226]